MIWGYCKFWQGISLNTSQLWVIILLRKYYKGIVTLDCQLVAILNSHHKVEPIQRVTTMSERCGVETQVSTGAYRPYSKTLYWTSWSATTFAVFAFRRFRAFRIFAHFAFSLISRTSHFSHSRAFRVFARYAHRTFRILAQFAFQIPHVFAHLTNYTHLAFPHYSQFAHSRIPRISYFRAFRVFRILAFFALRHALPRASLGSIAFRSHVLSSSSKVHWCVSHFVSLAFHHICPCIPLYVHLSY